MARCPCRCFLPTIQYPRRPLAVFPSLLHGSPWVGFAAFPSVLWWRYDFLDLFDPGLEVALLVWPTPDAPSASLVSPGRCGRSNAWTLLSRCRPLRRFFRRRSWFSQVPREPSARLCPVLRPRSDCLLLTATGSGSAATAYPEYGGSH